MPRIEVNFDDVPNEMPPRSQVDVGVHGFDITSAELKPAKSGSGTVIHLELTCKDQGPKEGEEEGPWPLRDWISTKVKVRMKRLGLSCGIDLSNGLQTEDLLGATCTATVKSRIFTNADGEQQEGRKIAQYEIPTEEGAEAVAGPGPEALAPPDAPAA